MFLAYRRPPFFILIPLLAGMMLFLAPGGRAATRCCCRYVDTSPTNECKPITEDAKLCSSYGISWGEVGDMAKCDLLEERPPAANVSFTPQVTIPNSSFGAGVTSEVTGTTFGEWISAVYVFFAGVMGVIAAVLVLWGGIKWTTAAGNAGRVTEAKDTIYSALTALLLTFGSYLILNTVNPELVKLKDLSDLIKPIGRIEQVLEIPRRISDAILRNPGLATEKNRFNVMACPSEEEMRIGFEVYLTGYYRPAWPASTEDIWKSSGGYENFPCNLGMQCRCPRDKSRQCNAGGLTWYPCDINRVDSTNYCNETASGTVPVEYPGDSPPFTAAGSPCFGFGTTFTLARSGSSGKIFSSPWVVADTGPDIQGRHFDLFLGTGDQARTEAVRVTGTATMQIKRFCTSPGVCKDISAP